MKNPRKEVQRLLKNPVIAAQGAIFVNQAFKSPFIQLELDPFPGHKHGKTCMFLPEEWARVVKIMKAYSKRGKKNSKKKGG